MSKVVKGISVQHFTAGWWGEHLEGKQLLAELGLPTNKMPFSVEQFLRKETVTLKDSNGDKASIWFHKCDSHFEFGCIYKEKQRKIRLFREWETEDLDTTIQLESYSIGDCTRKIIFGESIV